ncbi:hypothetical protein H4V98_000025 [Polaromonas sp. CG_23.6]|nr:hypothetical protein [Polaromonas sp. CG_23.6]
MAGRDEEWSILKTRGDSNQVLNFLWRDCFRASIDAVARRTQKRSIWLAAFVEFPR